MSDSPGAAADCRDHLPWLATTTQFTKGFTMSCTVAPQEHNNIGHDDDTELYRGSPTGVPGPAAAYEAGRLLNQLRYWLELGWICMSAESQLAIASSFDDLLVTARRLPLDYEPRKQLSSQIREAQGTWQAMRESDDHEGRWHSLDGNVELLISGEEPTSAGLELLREFVGPPLLLASQIATRLEELLEIDGKESLLLGMGIDQLVRPCEPYTYLTYSRPANKSRYCIMRGCMPRLPLRAGHGAVDVALVRIVAADLERLGFDSHVSEAIRAPAAAVAAFHGIVSAGRRLASCVVQVSNINSNVREAAALRDERLPSELQPERGSADIGTAVATEESGNRGKEASDQLETPSADAGWEAHGNLQLRFNHSRLTIARAGREECALSSDPVFVLLRELAKAGEEGVSVEDLRAVWREQGGNAAEASIRNYIRKARKPIARMALRIRRHHNAYVLEVQERKA